jgi:hypothetical protein
MSEWPMRGHFRYLRFKTFPMTIRTLQCEVFWSLLSSSEHSGVPENSKPPTFPSVGLHPHTWPKWGCDSNPNLGFTTKARACKVAGQKGSSGVTSHAPRNVGECEGTSTLPSELPLWELESQWTPEFLKNNCRGQNSLS